MQVNDFSSAPPPPRPAAQSPGGPPAAMPHAAGPQPATPPEAGRPVLSRGETEYFAELFPGASAEIRSHQAYASSARRPENAAGTIVDRRV